MAIIVDPDNLDRQQIIFGTTNQKISIRDVGGLIHSTLNDGYCNTVTNSRTVISTSSQFITHGVSHGDILCIFTSIDAGHYVIDTVDSETQITVLEDGYDFNVFSGAINARFDIREPNGGTVADGVSEQAIYSYAKEEWLSDSRASLGDDLIKYPFPFEAITREQMDIGGGGYSHENWNWFNEYTRKKIRTGGCLSKNFDGIIQTQWSGIITLGSLDSDSQVYYQLTNETTDPINFTFKGAVNELINVYTNNANDNRRYLKLFVRKKYRTYSQSQINEIGVSLLEPIVNRFPLSHFADPSIVSTDGAILGTDTYRTQSSISRAERSDGYKPTKSYIFTSAGSNFTNVLPGDTLKITSGFEQGYYTIESVNSQTQITILEDADFKGWNLTESNVSFIITTSNIIDPRNDGVLENINSITGTLTSALGGFTGVVTSGDYLIITDLDSDHQGVYKILSINTDNQLLINTADKTFTSQSLVGFKIVKPGMYLQRKQENIVSSPATGNLTFSNTNPDTIIRTSGSWVSDGVTIGDIITIYGSVSNDGAYTIASVSDSTITLIYTDSLINETIIGGLGDGIYVYRPFKRAINNILYGFKWRMFGAGGSLNSCYQFVQHQLRQSTNINYGPEIFRGDITDVLLSYSSSIGVTNDMYIDDLAATDINNVTWTDSSSSSRLEPYVAAGTIYFDSYLQNDPDATYKIYFTNDEAGDNIGRDYGTSSAIIVQDSYYNNISGHINGRASISFTYDYDGNIQRGLSSAGTNIPITIVAIGLNTAQFVKLEGVMTRAKTNSFSLVSSLERNYTGV